MGIGYALVQIKSVKDYTFHFKLDRETIGDPKITYFNIMSRWDGTALDSAGKMLVVVSADELESVKNFLLTLRS